MIAFDPILFNNVRDEILSESAERNGIGTLGEKQIHRVLKLYIDKNRDHHEVSVSGFVADVYDGEVIYEIQTRGFERLLPKLKVLLPTHKITIVYPLIAEKTLTWIDPESGEMTKPKHSPKHERPCDALVELARVAELLDNENLTVDLVFLKAEEYRSLDGWDKTCHKGATKLDKLPTELLDIVTVRSKKDIIGLLPPELPDKFFAKDFYKSLNRGGRGAWLTLKILTDLGIFRIAEKQGNALVYTIVNIA